MHRSALSVLACLAITGTAAAGDPCDADLDGDGTVNGLDLGIILAQWSIPVGAPACGGAIPCPADINGDGTVDGLDLGIVLANWNVTGCGGPNTETELAGNPLTQYPFFNYVTAFNQGSSINVAIDPTRFPAITGQTCRIYIVADKTAAQWGANPALVDATGGGFITHTFSGATIQTNTVLVDAGTLNGTTGTDVGIPYDVVCDCDQNGMLSPGDFIDGLSTGAGLYVVRDTAAAGPHAFTEVSYNVAGISSGFSGEVAFYPNAIGGMGQLPLVIVSHGNGHNQFLYNHIGEHLASYGYIVMSHHNNTGPGVIAASRTTLEHTNAIIGQQAAIAGGVLNGHIDANRIMWIGHSRGGEGVAIAYDNIFDGSPVIPDGFGTAVPPVGWNINSIKIISSMAPTDFQGLGLTDPHGANYHLWTAAADADVNGCASCNLCQTFHLHDRAQQFRQSTCIYGAGHGDLHDGIPGGGSVASGPCLTGRPPVNLYQKSYFLPLAKHYIENDVPSKDFLFRQYEEFRPIGAPDPVANPCFVVNHMYRDGDSAGNFMIDDFQTNPASNLSSSGGAVSMNVSNYVEGLADDNNGDFTWNAGDPMNGMTIGGPGDFTRAAVFDWNSSSFIEWAIIPAQQDMSNRGFLSFRACQGTRHPNTQALNGDLTFRVVLRDGSGTSSTIDLRAFPGGVEEPYARTSCGVGGAGYHNDFETIRVRLTDFLNNGSGLDLSDIVAVRFELGDTAPSSQGRMGIDEVAITNN